MHLGSVPVILIASLCVLLVITGLTIFLYKKYCNKPQQDQPIDQGEVTHLNPDFQRVEAHPSRQPLPRDSSRIRTIFVGFMSRLHKDRAERMQSHLSNISEKIESN